MTTKDTLSSFPICTPKYCRQKSLIPVALSPKITRNSPVRQWAVLPPPPRSKSSEKFSRNTKKPVLSVAKTSNLSNVKCIQNSTRYNGQIKSIVKQTVPVEQETEVNPSLNNVICPATVKKTAEPSNISHSDNLLASKAVAPLTYLKSYSVKYMVQLNNANKPILCLENKSLQPRFKSQGNQTDFRKKTNVEMSCTCSLKDKFLCYMFENVIVVLGLIMLIIIGHFVPISISFIRQTYKSLKPKERRTKDYIQSFFSPVIKWFLRQRIFKKNIELR